MALSDFSSHTTTVQVSTQLTLLWQAFLSNEIETSRKNTNNATGNNNLTVKDILLIF